MSSSLLSTTQIQNICTALRDDLTDFVSQYAERKHINVSETANGHFGHTAVFLKNTYDIPMEVARLLARTMRPTRVLLAQTGNKTIIYSCLFDTAYHVSETGVIVVGSDSRHSVLLFELMRYCLTR